MSACVRRNSAGIPVLLVALAVFVAIVPGAANAAPPRAAPADEAAVGKVLEGFIAALNGADINAFIAFFTPDATVFFPLASLPLRLENREQIATAFGAFFDGLRKRGPGPSYMNMIPVGTKVQFLGNVAVVTFHLKGEEMISRRTLVLQKLSGVWLIVHLHASNLALQKQ